MEKLIEILPANKHTDFSLSCEIGATHLAIWIENTATKMQEGIAVYQFDSMIDQLNEIKDFFSREAIFSGGFKSVHVFYQFKESVFVPFNLYNSAANADTLNLVHGDYSHYPTFLGSDIIFDAAVYNVYRIPQVIHEFFQTQFQQAIFTHSYSCVLKNKIPANDLLSITFYPKKMLVALANNSKWQLINAFDFENPHDVVYILLNICKQFNIPTIPIELNGLIEKDSALFSEIYKYFEVVKFASLPQNSNYQESILQYPKHYFGNFYALKSCE